MKGKKILIIILALLLLGCGGYFGYRQYQAYMDQFVTINETRYEKVLTELDLSGTRVGDLSVLQEMTALQSLNLQNTGLTVEQYEQLRAMLPECKIRWDVPFQGGYYPEETPQITVTSLTDEDVALLDYLPNLTTVYAEGCQDYAQLTALRERRPECAVEYTIEVAGTRYSYAETEMTIPGEAAQQLIELLPYFPELTAVTLQEPLGDSAYILELNANPQLSVSWQVAFHDMTLDKETTTLDLTGMAVTVEEVENLIPYLPGLTYVDMTDCGISNEEMDALNRRHENVKIVWTVDIGNIMRVKTDETWFMPGKWQYWVYTDDVYNLRYCTDMICVDIGHMRVADCEWARYMPNLKYLLIGDTLITDLSPIAGLQELVFLEIFLTDITDYTPLLECPALEDINLHFTYGDPNVIKQLTWVNNVWWRNINLTDEDKQMLREALPNTHFEFNTIASTGAGWRKLQNYYDHRDLMGMFYMD